MIRWLDAHIAVDKLQHVAVLRDGRKHELAVGLQLLRCKLQRVAFLRDGRESECSSL